MTLVDPNLRLILGSEHIATSIGEETAIMSIARSRYYAVGAVAGRIWELLGNPVTPREIVAILVDEYDIGEEQCLNEVGSFVSELIEEGLVVEYQP